MKRRNKAKYLTWNFIRSKFMKKTSMPNPVKSIGYIKYYSSSSPRPVKSPSNCITYNCQKICSWSRRPKTILDWKSAKRPHVSKWSTILLFTSFWKTFTNHRKNTNRAVVFGCRLFPKIPKYRDHQLDLSITWKTRLLQTIIDEFC